MPTIDVYINILLDSLDKKEYLMNNILKITNEQKELLNNLEENYDRFNNLIDIKQHNIDDLEILDQGFQVTFDRISNELNDNINVYRDKLIILKEKIKFVTDIGINIQVIEQRNNIKLKEKLSIGKNKVKTYKKSNRTVSNYYKNMANAFKNEACFVDNKK